MLFTAPSALQPSGCVPAPWPRPSIVTWYAAAGGPYFYSTVAITERMSVSRHVCARAFEYPEAHTIRTIRTPADARKRTHPGHADVRHRPGGVAEVDHVAVALEVGAVPDARRVVGVVEAAGVVQRVLAVLLDHPHEGVVRGAHERRPVEAQACAR